MKKPTKGNYKKSLPLLVVIVATIIAVAFVLFFNRQEDVRETSLSSHETGELLNLLGHIAMIGNEPFSRLAIITGEGKEGEVFEIVGKKSEELSDLQGVQVEIKGRVIGSGINADKKVEVLEYQRRRNAAELIKKAYVQGEIDYDTRMLYLTYSIFEPESLPKEYQSSVLNKDATSIILETKRNWSKLSSQTQNKISIYIQALED